MKNKFRLFIIGFIIFGICPVLSHAQVNVDGAGVRDKQVKPDGVQNPSSQPSGQPSGDNIEWVKNASKKHSPASWDLLMKYEKMPPEIEGQRKGWWIVTMKKPVSTFDQLNGENKKADLIDRMALNVRVVDLALQRHDLFQYAKDKKLQLDWDNAEVLLNLPPDKSYYISFPIKSLFPSVQLTELIPKDRKTFFFDTYIKGGTITQRFGVIGLLEEYHGYYFGSKYYFDMLDAYKTIETSDTDGFFEWARSSQSTMSAFYELDYLIREYLLYMKEQRPADYDALKSYRPFVEAYGAVRSSYESLIDQYLALVDTEIKRLNSIDRSRIGLDSNGLLWIKSQNNRNITGTYVLPDREKLIALLKGDRYRALMKDFPKM